jgi:hypothetical protein
MKIAVAVVVALLGLLFTFAYFHSKSIDRTRLVHSVNDLLEAQRQLQEHGSVTDATIAARVYSFTNRVLVDDTSYLAELATEVAGMEDVGRLIAATDGTVVWIDSRSGAVLVRSPDGSRWVRPRRFRDF